MSYEELLQEVRGIEDRSNVDNIWKKLKVPHLQAVYSLFSSVYKTMPKLFSRKSKSNLFHFPSQLEGMQKEA
jgi:hypothetical protein